MKSFIFRCFGSGLCSVIITVLPSILLADEGTLPAPHVDSYIAVFGGATFPSDTDVKVDDNARDLHFTVLDQTFSKSKSLGGKVGAWFPGFRRSTALDLGLEIDVTNYQPDVKAGHFRATGTANGNTVVGATMPATLDVNSTIVAMNVLLRLPLYVSEEYPHGRLYPYIGGGPGFQNSSFGSQGKANYDFAVQGVAGVHVFLIRQVSIFAEYKFTHAEQTFGFITSTGTTQDERYTFNVSHAVAGLAVHFGS